ncbi:MAG: COX15/CtaA family protein, partial [Chloroflexi bacterium]|nr:COX15/CtaA family protein [Chloroflexota bacterium]
MSGDLIARRGVKRLEREAGQGLYAVSPRERVRLRLRDWFPALAWATLVTTLMAVIMGGVVRVTGSGLGCPDWPL